MVIVVEKKRQGFYTAEVNGNRVGWSHSLERLFELLADKSNEIEAREVA